MVVEMFFKFLCAKNLIAYCFLNLSTFEFEFTIWGALMLVAAQRLAQAKGNDEIEEDGG